MTIQEAIKSKKRIRRTMICSDFCLPMGGGTQGLFFDSLQGQYFLDVDDILATDWEIEEKKIEVTESKLRDVLEISYTAEFPVKNFVEEVLKELGF